MTGGIETLVLLAAIVGLFFFGRWETKRHAKAYLDKRFDEIVVGVSKGMAGLIVSYTKLAEAFQDASLALEALGKMLVADRDEKKARDEHGHPGRYL